MDDETKKEKNRTRQREYYHNLPPEVRMARDKARYSKLRADPKALEAKRAKARGWRAGVTPEKLEVQRQKAALRYKKTKTENPSLAETKNAKARTPEKREARRQKKKRDRNSLSREFVQYAITRAGIRARKKDFGFDLNSPTIVDGLHRRLQVGFCEVSGLPWVFADKLGPSLWSPTLDRIDNNRGYTIDNVRWVVWIFNRAKGADTDADVELLARALVERADRLRKS